MKRSSFLIPTLKEKPSEAQVVSHELMLRAGMIRKVGSGFYTYLPFGLKILKKVESVIREEMDKVGAQEMLFPILIPKELWETTGRWNAFKKELFRVSDRHAGEYALGPTHEEAFAHFVKAEIGSYRDLPLNLYQIGTKFRDEIRPRFGVMRSKEFLMKDAYSFNLDDACLDEVYSAMRKAYIRVFERCGLDFAHVKADTGSMGGSDSEEFMVKSDVGEETIVTCSHCGYAANVETAKAILDYPEYATGEVEKVSTPGKKTIEEVSGSLQVPMSQTMKTVIYHVSDEEGLEAGGKDVMVLIRGDMEINEVKLEKVFSGRDFRKSNEEEIKRLIDAPVGFLGPVTDRGIELKVDVSLQGMKGMICGANEEDTHLKNVDVGEDFNVETYVDVYQVKEGDACPQCQTDLNVFKGIEVGHIFKLGKKYTEAFDINVLDKDGKRVTPTMGCYGIGVNRTMAAVIEQHHDEQGIKWPLSLCPFQVVLITLNVKDEKSMHFSQELYLNLQKEGMDVLWDERNERAGFKFKDADLIGIPLQVVVGSKGLDKNECEVKWRDEGEKTSIQADQAAEVISQMIASRRN